MLQLTGAGVMPEEDEVEEDEDGVKTVSLAFYIPGDGPQDDTTEAAKSLWGMFALSHSYDHINSFFN